MNLLIEYFRSPDYQRHSEYLTCIHENLENEYIDKVYIFISDDAKLNFQSDKIEIVQREERPTYKDLFEFCNENLKNQICIIANADIILDETLSAVKETNLDNIFVALTRWEVFCQNGEWCIAPFDNSSSQDVWIFTSPIKTTDEMEFTLGKPGCDNKIAKLMAEQGYILKNPGKQIVCAHYHISGHRNYNNNDRIPGPYTCLVPNDDINAETQLIEIDGFDEQGRAYRIERKSDD
jgi:hypothetical protein